MPTAKDETMAKKIDITEEDYAMPAMGDRILVKRDKGEEKPNLYFL